MSCASLTVHQECFPTHTNGRWLLDVTVFFSQFAFAQCLTRAAVFVKIVRCFLLFMNSEWIRALDGFLRIYFSRDLLSRACYDCGLRMTCVFGESLNAKFSVSQLFRQPNAHSNSENYYWAWEYRFLHHHHWVEIVKLVAKLMSSNKKQRALRRRECHVRSTRHDLYTRSNFHFLLIRYVYSNLSMNLKALEITGELRI